MRILHARPSPDDRTWAYRPGAAGPCAEELHGCLQEGGVDFDPGVAEEGAGDALGKEVTPEDWNLRGRSLDPLDVFSATTQILT